MSKLMVAVLAAMLAVPAFAIDDKKPAQKAEAKKEAAEKKDEAKKEAAAEKKAAKKKHAAEKKEAEKKTEKK